VIFNKLEEIVHLFGFTIEMYREARSRERLIYCYVGLKSENICFLLV